MQPAFYCVQLINVDTIAAELKTLDKDNDMIYHEPVPTGENLPVITRAAMVKEIPPTLDAGGM